MLADRSTMAEANCCCGTSCAMGGLPIAPRDQKHKCATCKQWMHGICGVPRPETDPGWSILYSTCCNGCSSKANNKPAPPKPPPKEKATAKKKPPRPSRPDITCEEFEGTEATEWHFPTDKPKCLAPFVEFMSFIHLFRHLSHSRSRCFAV